MSAFSQRAVLISIVLAYVAVFISAECPNACSSHGRCGAFDACECYRNWMSNDCSERICQFGLAHVDTPKGDLDSSSGELYSPEATSETAMTPGSRVAAPVVVGSAMYPHGTHERYPNMVDSQNTILSQTAHEYMECSNKGICDRSVGTCSCFEGYDGSACQRSSCPSSGGSFCSGHGICATIKDIAKYDYNNSYNLWDEHSTMGCVCDPGFEGPDCSMLMCKVGADPLYYDDVVNVRYSNFTFSLWNIDSLTVDLDRHSQWFGNFSIVFYDAHGEDWHTSPIDINADCDDIRSALETIPNNVIPARSVRCSMDVSNFGTYLSDDWDVESTAFRDSYYNETKRYGGLPDAFPINLPDQTANTETFLPFVGTKFTLAFTGNPGKLRQPQIDLQLDGSRRTVTAVSPRESLAYNSTEYANLTIAKNMLRDMVTNVRTWVFPNGFTGEDEDFVPDLCQGVKVTMKRMSSGSSSTFRKWGMFDDISAAESVLLKKCLGDADGDPKNNNRNKATDTQDSLYNWDYGITVDELSTASSFRYDNDYLLNPHLVKLVDSSPDSATRLCDTSGHQFSGPDDIQEIGYCSNIDPPGFYIVLYFDPKLNKFIFLSPVWKDFEVATEFFVFTTSGYLQLASKSIELFTAITRNLAAVSGIDLYKAWEADLGRLYSNVVYTTQPIDCETASDKVYALQCIEKGDYVMIFNTEEETASITTSTNPKYMNIYQVMKISRENLESTDNDESVRYQIVLDMSMNARYPKTIAGNSPARIYKFTPPAVPVKYAGPCSLRGICDSTSGLCTCFPGYTGDDCSAMNALAI